MKIGDKVKITNGCYKDLIGTITNIGPNFYRIKPDEPCLPAMAFTENEFVLLT